MMTLKRYIPFVCGVTVLLTARFLIVRPAFVYAGSVLILGIVLLSVAYEFIGSHIAFWERVRFMLHISLFIGSGVLLFLFVEQDFIKYIVALLLALLMFLYLENTFRFLYKTEKYHVSALRNLASYMQVLTLFFISVSLFNFRFFFAVSLPVLTGAGFIALLGLFYVWLWTKRLHETFLWWMPFLAAILFAQFFVTVTFLPLIPLVKGIVTTTLSYGMIELFVFSLLQEGVQKKRIERTLVLVGLVLLLSLATARWF